MISIMPCRLRTSLREVLEIIQASNDRNRMKSILESNPKFRCLENEKQKMQEDILIKNYMILIL